MIHTPLATYLALNKIEGFGPKHIAYFEKNYADITSFLRLSNGELAALNWKEKQIQQWRSLSWQAIETELAWAEKPNCHILHWHDIHYSRLLREIHDPPTVLYVKGQLDTLNRPTMAVIGTRHPSPYGKENAAHFSRQLAEIGFCISSGLAIGIDGVAHHAAFSYPAGSIAVIATGVDQVYPERHKQLANHLLENGAIISEFPFKTPPRPENFPRRNRIISGLSQGLLVIEAALKSGSLITARYAMEQGREVFAIPGMIQNSQTQGCHALIRQGAVLVSSVEQILEELRLLPDTKMKPLEEKAIDHPLSKIDLSIHPTLLEKIDYSIPISIDKLVEITGLSANQITTQLFDLEIAGYIEKSPEGGYWRLFNTNQV